MRFIHILCSPVEEIKIYNRTLRRVALIKRAQRETAEVSSPSRARVRLRRANPSACINKRRLCYKVRGSAPEKGSPVSAQMPRKTAVQSQGAIAACPVCVGASFQQFRGLRPAEFGTRQSQRPRPVAFCYHRKVLVLFRRSLLRFPTPGFRDILRSPAVGLARQDR